MTIISTIIPEPEEYPLIENGICVSCKKAFEPPEEDKRKIIKLYSLHKKDVRRSESWTTGGKATTIVTTYDEIQMHIFETCPECQEKQLTPGGCALAAGSLGFIFFVILYFVSEMWREAPMWLIRTLQIPFALLAATFIISLVLYIIQYRRVNSKGKAMQAVSAHREKMYSTFEYIILDEAGFKDLKEKAPQAALQAGLMDLTDQLDGDE